MNYDDKFIAEMRNTYKDALLKLDIEIKQALIDGQELDSPSFRMLLVKRGELKRELITKVVEHVELIK